MIIDIALSGDLNRRWRPRVQRQLDFKLASAASSVRVLRVSLTQATGIPLGENYRCNMQAMLVDGGTEEVCATGSPNIAIADAAARLARSIGRRAKRKDTSWGNAVRG